MLEYQIQSNQKFGIDSLSDFLIVQGNIFLQKKKYIQKINKSNAQMKI